MGKKRSLQSSTTPDKSHDVSLLKVDSDSEPNDYKMQIAEKQTSELRKKIQKVNVL